MYLNTCVDPRILVPQRRRGDVDRIHTQIDRPFWANKVVNADSVEYRDRQTLQEDLFRMREFRAQRGYAAGYR